MSTKQQLIYLGGAVVAAGLLLTAAITSLMTFINSLPDAPTATIDVAPLTITEGESATLTWTTSGATCTTLNGEHVGASDTLIVSPAVGTHVYTLTATGAGGEATDDATLIVEEDDPPPPGGVVTAQAGDWSATTTWVGGTVPTASDDVSVLHSVIVDTGVTVGDGRTLTVAANVTQANFTVTVQAGGELVLDTTGGNLKWLQGTAASQHNCKIVSTGTEANPATIRKTGTGFAYFDVGDEGAGGVFDCTGWDLLHCNVVGIGSEGSIGPNGPMAIGISTFGNISLRFRNVTFDGCGTVGTARPYSWGASANKDFQFENCRWQNSRVDSINAYFTNGYPGTGIMRFCGNVTDKPPNLTFKDANIDDNYFDECLALGGLYATFDRNTIREGTRQATFIPTNGLKDTYVLADHRGDVGNPHFISNVPTGVFDGIVFDYPHELLIDGGDGIYGNDSGSFAGGEIRNCLVLPSMTDGVCSTNLLAMTSGGAAGSNNIKLYHNTIVGKIAQLTFNERNLTGQVPVLECRSNLIAGDSQQTSPPEWGAIAYDLNVDTINQVDTVQGITHNYVHNPIIFTDPVTGLPQHGCRIRLTAPPDSTNILEVGGTGPQFVDRTRCAARWAVHKGAVGAEPALPHTDPAWIAWKFQALDAVRQLLRDDPALGNGDLLPWVKAGFVTQNPALQNTGHDGQHIGALGL